MGALLSEKGKGIEAEKLHRHALEGRKRVLGKDHEGTLTSITNLAVALDCQCEYIKAEVLHREALQGIKDVLGKEHPGTLSTSNALAWNLHNRGKYDEALSLMQITAEGRVSPWRQSSAF